MFYFFLSEFPGFGSDVVDMDTMEDTGLADNTGNAATSPYQQRMNNSERLRFSTDIEAALHNATGGEDNKGNHGRSHKKRWGKIKEKKYVGKIYRIFLKNLQQTMDNYTFLHVKISVEFL